MFENRVVCSTDLADQWIQATLFFKDHLPNNSSDTLGLNSVN